MQFYNVRKKCSAVIPDNKCVKRKTVTSKGRTVYMVKAVDTDGTKLTIFTNKDAYEALNCPAED